MLMARDKSSDALSFGSRSEKRRDLAYTSFKNEGEFWLNIKSTDQFFTLTTGLKSPRPWSYKNVPRAQHSTKNVREGTMAKSERQTLENKNRMRSDGKRIFFKAVKFTTLNWTLKIRIPLVLFNTY